MEKSFILKIFYVNIFLIMELITRKWLERARYDLSSAKIMYNSKRYLYAAFMCQQALEKILKAVLIENKRNVPRIHNLVRLAEQAEVYNLMASADQDFLADLTPYAIESRYGDYKKNLSEIIDKKSASQYLNATERMFKWLKKNLRKQKK